LGEIKEFMESTEEDASLLQDTEWILDLAFLNGHDWETEPFEL